MDDFRDRIPFDRWFAGAEHMAGHALDVTAAREAWEKGKDSAEYVTSMNPPCETCKIPGAPAHEPSPRCHYKARGYDVTHCTCRACY